MNICAQEDENGDWRRLYIMELNSLYCSSNKSRRLSWAGHIAKKEEDRSALKILTDEPMEKRPLKRPKGRWESNIRMNLKRNSYQYEELD